MKLTEAKNLALQIRRELKPFCYKFRVAGSVRRRVEYPNDLDIVIIPSDKERLIRKLESMGFQAGNKRAYYKGLFKGVKVQIALTTRKSIGATMLWATGPAQSNIGMRAKASRMGYKLNRWGLYRAENMEFIEGKSNKIRYLLGVGRKIYTASGPKRTLWR